MPGRHGVCPPHTPGVRAAVRAADAEPAAAQGRQRIREGAAALPALVQGPHGLGRGAWGGGVAGQRLRVRARS